MHEGLDLETSLSPLYKVYINDENEVLIVTPDAKHGVAPDGQAFFLGYTPLDIRDADGQQISNQEHHKRLRRRA